jgi:hypothetical protein
MMAVLIEGRAKLPDGAKREYSSYCGNYTFDGSTLITTVECQRRSRARRRPASTQGALEGGRA